MNKKADLKTIIEILLVILFLFLLIKIGQKIFGVVYK